jgi:hypothetical protein
MNRDSRCVSCVSQALGPFAVQNHRNFAHSACLSKTERDTDLGTARRYFQNDFRRAFQLMRRWKATIAYLLQLRLLLLRESACAGARPLVEEGGGNLCRL